MLSLLKFKTGIYTTSTLHCKCNLEMGQGHKTGLVINPRHVITAQTLKALIELNSEKNPP